MSGPVLVVADDLQPAAEQAIRAALEYATLHDAASIHVVHVIDQPTLDGTGMLEIDQKKTVALDRAYPQIWKRVREIGSYVGMPNDVSVDVRFAAVHTTRVHMETAKQLLTVAADFEASMIVIGRRGRPSGVADHLDQLGHLQEFDGETETKAIFLRPADGKLEWNKSSAWHSEHGTPSSPPGEKAP